MLKDWELGKAIRELSSKLVRIEMPPNQNKLVARGRLPVLTFEVKPGTAELKDIAQFAFLEPGNALGPKYIL